MRAIVTGANGFIGYHLVQLLVQRGFEVFCFTRHSSRTASGPTTSSVQQIAVDYNDPTTLFHENVCTNIDYVFHVAGVTKGAAAKDFYKGNVIPTHNLLEMLRTHTIVPKRFVLVSSLAAAGPAQSLEHPVKETDTLHPVEEYGRSKRVAEQTALHYAAHIPVTIIRPSAVYGPRDKDFFNLFSIIHHGFSVFYGNRKKYLSIIHAHDLVEGIIDAAISENTVGKIYHCGNQIVQWDDVHNAIIRAVGKKPTTLSLPAYVLDIAAWFGNVYAFCTHRVPLINSQKIQLAYPWYWTCDSSTAHNDFGFNPRISLDEGMAETYRWYCEKGWIKI